MEEEAGMMRESGGRNSGENGARAAWDAQSEGTRYSLVALAVWL
jgi:hypothetical protein